MPATKTPCEGMCLLRECTDDLGGDVEEEDGRDEGEREDEDDERVTR